MAIHPIEYRYGTDEMKFVWSEANRLDKLMETEAALAMAEADIGLIPKVSNSIIRRGTICPPPLKAYQTNSQNH